MLINGTIADEAELLRVCLRALGVGTKQVVQSLTRNVPRSDDKVAQTASYLRKRLKGLQEETLTDFLAKNEDQYPVAPDLTLDGELLCVSHEELTQVFRDDKGWERFRETYPASSGIADFSRVGFNPDLTQALVYAGMQLDRRAGHGSYMLYNRSEGGWVESAGVMAWVS